ncbi:MAG TPA: hypothetical protein VII56_12370 [Rhizomicrobium sp.]
MSMPQGAVAIAHICAIHARAPGFLGSKLPAVKQLAAVAMLLVAAFCDIPSRAINDFAGEYDK